MQMYMVSLGVAIVLSMIALVLLIQIIKLVTTCLYHKFMYGDTSQCSVPRKQQLKKRTT